MKTLIKKKYAVIAAVTSLIIFGSVIAVHCTRTTQPEQKVATGDSFDNNSDEDSSSSQPVKKSSSQAETVVPSIAEASGCDESLWQHVYNPTRLAVISRCVTVTGIVEESSTNPDGDAHMGLKLDAAYSSMVNDVNKSRKNGDLIIESVCNQPPEDSKVGSACDGYQAHVMIPAVGDHVKITGAFVDDTHNGWNEIHPVTSISRL